MEKGFQSVSNTYKEREKSFKTVSNFSQKMVKFVEKAMEKTFKSVSQLLQRMVKMI